MVQIKQKQGVSEGVLFPEILQLPASEAAVLQGIMDDLSAVGFDLSDLGGGSYAINGIPSGIEGLNPVELVRNMLHTAMEKGNDVKEEIQNILALTLARAAAIVYGQVLSNEESWKAVEYYREYYQDTGIFECSVYPGFEKSLKALKAAGKRLFVATSKPEVYARRIIEHFDLDQYFEYVAGMELDGGRGSKAEVIGYLIDTCRMQDKKRILMIGDREHDVLGASSAILYFPNSMYQRGTG